jgi:hypothetical protein
MGMPMEEEARRKFDVTIEYDNSEGERVQKTLPTMNAGKAFFIRQMVKGRNPKVLHAAPPK